MDKQLRHPHHNYRLILLGSRGLVYQHRRLQRLRSGTQAFRARPTHHFAPCARVGLARKIQRAIRPFTFQQQLMAACEGVGQGVACAQGLRSNGGKVMLLSTVIGPLAGT